MLQQPEWWLAASITLLIAWFHFYFWLHAGGLWRDEVNSLNVARANSISDWKICTRHKFRREFFAAENAEFFVAGGLEKFHFDQISYVLRH